MDGKYFPEIDMQKLAEVQNSGDLVAYYDLLCQPLHEELYRRQDFAFMNELTPAQRALLLFDYIQMQVLQGGFIQLFQNGYAGLLPDVIDWFTKLAEDEMAKVLDDALKVYVLNKELLDKDTTPEEFAQLYNELLEFEEIDKRFETLHAEAVKGLLTHAAANIAEYVMAKGH